MSERYLYITPGDTTGIGPEITVKFLNRHVDSYKDTVFTVFGGLSALEREAKALGLPLQPRQNIRFVDIPGELPGAVSYQALEQAVETIVCQQPGALVTGPISKSNLKAAGILAQGHTEILEVLARRFYPQQKPKAEMLFVFQNFRLMLLTRHVPLSRVTSQLSAQNNRRTIEVLRDYLIYHLGIRQPKIAVLGVNPHAGEVGGVEESLVLSPLIDYFNRQGTCVMEGPFAADAFFRGLDPSNLQYDAVIATYHDQGLIPFKLLAGFKAVNVTIGLPFIRTSVSHGTAEDIAGKGLATEESLVAAVDTALLLAKNPTLPLLA